METVVQILEAEKLAPIMYIPKDMLHSRIEVTLRPINNTSSGQSQAGKINERIMRKFQKAAETDEAREYLKKKLALGTQFDFDATKLINGTMSEDDWQNLYALQKQAWTKAAAENAGMDNA